MQESKKPIANSQIVLREEFDDWAILFDPDSGRTFGLNPVSVLIWKMLDGKHTVSDITAEIKQKCISVSDDCGEHVRKFLSDIEEKGFLGYEKIASGETREKK